jgi:hypothetical protein
MKYTYKTFALGGILAGSLIAAPAAFAHGDRYSSNTSQSYAWIDDTYSSSSDRFSSSDENSFQSNYETSQMSNDSEPDQNVLSRLERDRDKLARDLSSGASDDQIAQDQRAIEIDEQGMHETVAFTGDGTVVVIPGS